LTPAVRYTIPLSECSTDQAELIGGKALGLCALLATGSPVPPAFVVTTRAYAEAVAAGGLPALIEDLLSECPAAAVTGIEAPFAGLTMPANVRSEVADALRELGPGPVAVRSSAVAEDRDDASFAGQQETYLFIEGEEQVATHVVRCWASLYTERAIAYRARFDVPAEDVMMAVVVQQMVPATAAGVLMTIDPVSGDDREIYIEAAHGLGEGVVRGGVSADRYWLEKRSLEVVREELGQQREQWRFDPDHRVVRAMPLEAEVGDRPAISRDQLRRLGQLAVAVERSENRAMDIEWAVDPSGEVLLLQSRPETVWRNRPNAPVPGAGFDTLHSRTRSDSWWTSTNVGEAVPFPTPLCWSIWGTAGELGLRQTFYEIGALSQADTRRPRAEQDQLFGIFYGRPAFHLNLICAWGDRLPATSGAAMAEQICGFAPDDLNGRPDYRYYPRAIAKALNPLLRARRLATAVGAETASYWAARVACFSTLDERAALAMLLDASERFNRCAYSACMTLFGATQPAFLMLKRVAERANVDPTPLMSGLGNHGESAVVKDMWAASRDRLTAEQFLARHGYHGPSEGETSARVWREDPTPLLRLIDRYRAAPDSEDPTARERDRAQQRAAAVGELLAATAPWQRPAVKFVLRFVERNMPLRSVPKIAAQQANDVIRGAARRLGHHLAVRGALAEEDDIFYLTIDELRAGIPADARDRVADRRAHRDAYRAVELPAVWQGEPKPATHTVHPDAELINGTGASAGIVEGTARVVAEPADASIQSGEILVARNTDQGWASLMYLSRGLVTDIGGVMSHTAVVARELGIPCIVGTQTATLILDSGDRIRIDGTAGTVEIIERAATAPSAAERLEDA
jgi:rifampicin phosphotransferase